MCSIITRRVTLALCVISGFAFQAVNGFDPAIWPSGEIGPRKHIVSVTGWAVNPVAEALGLQTVYTRVELSTNELPADLVASDYRQTEILAAVDERASVLGVQSVYDYEGVWIWNTNFTVVGGVVLRPRDKRQTLAAVKSWIASNISNFVCLAYYENPTSYYSSASGYVYEWKTQLWVAAMGGELLVPSPHNLGRCGTGLVSTVGWVLTRRDRIEPYSLLQLSKDASLPISVITNDYDIPYHTAHYYKIPGWMAGQYTSYYAFGKFTLIREVPSYFEWTPRRDIEGMDGRTESVEYLSGTDPFYGFWNPVAKGYTTADYGYARIVDVFTNLVVTYSQASSTEYIYHVTTNDANAFSYSRGTLGPYPHCWNGSWVINEEVEQSWDCEQPSTEPFTPSFAWRYNVSTSSVPPEYLYRYVADEWFSAGSYNRSGTCWVHLGPETYSYVMEYNYTAGHRGGSSLKHDVAVSHVSTQSLGRSYKLAMVGYSELSFYNLWSSNCSTNEPRNYIWYRSLPSLAFVSQESGSFGDGDGIESNVCVISHRLSIEPAHPLEPFDVNCYHCSYSYSTNGECLGGTASESYFGVNYARQRYVSVPSSEARCDILFKWDFKYQ